MKSTLLNLNLSPFKTENNVLNSKTYCNDPYNSNVFVCYASLFPKVIKVATLKKMKSITLKERGRIRNKV